MKYIIAIIEFVQEWCGEILVGILFGLLAAGFVFLIVHSSKHSHETVVIDGCEYLMFEEGSHGYTHKGNCTNSIHQR